MAHHSEKVVLDELEIATNTPERRERRGRWGYVSALPSEYLIVYRRGKLRDKVSGQGARCFKWPSDTVAIVPTTLKEVLFRANQITIDNVDVQLRGMVLYRIVDPLRIYRLVNFTNREQAEAKLGRIVADTCRSTAKWLVANMTVDQCMRRRKEEIATALTAEVARVVGSGDPAGWGVEIVTVDIQDIFIQDDQLFAAMQARFKAEKEGEAARARLEADREVQRHAIAVERALAEEKQQLSLEQARLASEVELAGITNMRRTEQEKFELDRFRVQENATIAQQRIAAENDREILAAEGRRQRAEIDAESATIASQQEIEVLRNRLAAESSASPASIERLFMTEALPELARTFAESASHMRFSVFQNAGDASASASPLGFLLSQLLELLDQRIHRGVVSQPRAEPVAETGAAERTT
jgi:flotillin